MIIIINGKGGCGKDSFVNSVNKVYPVANTSIINYARELSIREGWLVEDVDKPNYIKSDKGRKFLSDLKVVLDSFDIPLRHLLKEICTKEDVKFVHMREESDILEFMNVVNNCYPDERIFTLLVKSSSRWLYEHPHRRETKQQNPQFQAQARLHGNLCYG